MASAEAAIERLCDPAAEVSAHYVIAKTGEITQLVPEHLRAWHAGAGEWAGLTDINSRSIGIELDNDGTAPFAEPLMDALTTLLAQIMARHGIPPGGVIGHSDMAPGRKIDPGPRFDWHRLERLGLARASSTASAPTTCDANTLRAHAHTLGYTAEADDATLLQTLRARFRPYGAGPLCPEDFRALPAI